MIDLSNIIYYKDNISQFKELVERNCSVSNTSEQPVVAYYRNLQSKIIHLSCICLVNSWPKSAVRL